MLDQGVLRQAISPMFRAQSMPRGSVSDVVRQWATAYSSYSSSALAGGSLLPSPAVIGPASQGRFIDSLDSMLRAIWSTTVWTGPAAVGTTLFVPSLSAIFVPVTAQLVTSRDSDLALSLITGALHTYTLSITVSVTPASGVPFIVPLT